MKLGLYLKLAWVGVRNNRRLYLPYLLTCVCMVMMQYIVGHLAGSSVVDSLRGGATLGEMLGLGSYIIALFAFLFLNYSSSFLIRRRKKEFGLYNILGMEKKHIAVVLALETLFTAALSLIVGLFAGVALSKAAELCVVNFMRGSVSYALTLSVNSLVLTLQVYLAIFALILLRSLWQIRKSSALNLLRSENVGEKLPRFYPLWGVLGVCLLAVAYCLAAANHDALSAVFIFFIAVVLVILATYLLFISGSVLLCKLLQKNKRYYYRPNHFVSVSSMAYRMTRNGAGLASICILLTMVLVMLSSTSCLYFGAEDSLLARYPRQLIINTYSNDLGVLGDDSLQTLRDVVAGIVDRHGASQENVLDYRTAIVYGQLQDNNLETNPDRMRINSTNIYGDVRTVLFVPLEDYNRLTRNDCALQPGEALLYEFHADYDEEVLDIPAAGLSFRIKERVSDFPVDTDSLSSITPSMYLVIPDIQATLEPLSGLANTRGDSLLETHCVYYFDVNADQAIQMDIYESLGEASSQLAEYYSYTVIGARAEEYDSYIGLFAGLLMLGIVLSIVFLFAAVLMIYYKQITEGYEDQSRFEIMQKVGMTRQDIRRSINSQMLTVFLLPLLTAGLHMTFAFPIIRALLSLFNMTNAALFIQTCLGCFAIFGLFYIIVYRITSNAYYSIVSGAKSA